jgi:hypothetical protein
MKLATTFNAFSSDVCGNCFYHQHLLGKRARGYFYTVEDLSCDESYSERDFGDVAFDGEHKDIGEFA